MIPVTHESFKKNINAWFGAAEVEINRKNADYAGESESAFAAFEEVAEALGLTPMEVWATYYMKHVQALMRYIKGGKLESEGIRSRLLDLTTYPAILEAMITDGE